jgi:hypothetical protein
MTKSVAGIIGTIFQSLRHFVRHIIMARKRRLARERRFYRDLIAHCRANDLPLLIAEDWKTLYYERKP